jgi:hypothetical protein
MPGLLSASGHARLIARLGHCSDLLKEPGVFIHRRLQHGGDRLRGGERWLHLTLATCGRMSEIASTAHVGVTPEVPLCLRPCDFGDKGLVFPNQLFEVVRMHVGCRV